MSGLGGACSGVCRRHLPSLPDPTTAGEQYPSIATKCTPVLSCHSDLSEGCVVGQASGVSKFLGDVKEGGISASDVRIGASLMLLPPSQAAAQ